MFSSNLNPPPLQKSIFHIHPLLLFIICSSIIFSSSVSFSLNHSSPDLLEIHLHYAISSYPLSSSLLRNPRLGLGFPVAEPRSEFTNGIYTFTSINGTVKKTKIGDLNRQSTVAERTTGRASNGRLDKRQTSCWGNNLNHYDVDFLVDMLKEWSVGGGEVHSGDKGTSGWISKWNDVILYYCVVTANTYGNLDLVDVNYAPLQMDSACPPYTASWFRWPGSSEIVGKATNDQEICRYEPR